MGLIADTLWKCQLIKPKRLLALQGATERREQALQAKSLPRAKRVFDLTRPTGRLGMEVSY